MVTPGVRYVLYARPFHIIVVLAPLAAGAFVIFYEAVRRWGAWVFPWDSESRKPARRGRGRGRSSCS